jgi:hypothetical protein
VIIPTWSEIADQVNGALRAWAENAGFGSVSVEPGTPFLTTGLMFLRATVVHDGVQVSVYPRWNPQAVGSFPVVVVVEGAWPHFPGFFTSRTLHHPDYLTVGDALREEVVSMAAHVKHLDQETGSQSRYLHRP